ncbi:hypothetical protein K438DRAFT_1989339 [Mycena galopus ATCC 62051]|nr:hypothetical protein K438DRAFT_1989339 [Mycena galopus ATCC 62051]
MSLGLPSVVFSNLPAVGKGTHEENGRSGSRHLSRVLSPTHFSLSAVAPRSKAYGPILAANLGVPALTTREDTAPLSTQDRILGTQSDAEGVEQEETIRHDPAPPLFVRRVVDILLWHLVLRRARALLSSPSGFSLFVPSIIPSRFLSPFWRRRRPHFCGNEQRLSKSMSNRSGAACKTKGSGDWSIGMGRSGKMRSRLVCKIKTSLFEKARRYLPDDKANPDQSSEEI